MQMNGGWTHINFSNVGCEAKNCWIAKLLNDINYQGGISQINTETHIQCVQNMPNSVVFVFGKCVRNMHSMLEYLAYSFRPPMKFDITVSSNQHLVSTFHMLLIRLWILHGNATLCAIVILWNRIGQFSIKDGALEELLKFTERSEINCRRLEYCFAERRL